MKLIGNILLDVVLSMLVSKDYKVPTKEEMISFKDADSFIDWMIKKNPTKEKEIIETFTRFKKLNNNDGRTD